ncbi:MAG: thioredoxin domain-containing protein [Acidobacteriota bacterium]
MKNFVLAGVLAVVGAGAQVVAQAQTADVPAPAPTPKATAAANPFPAVNPKNFTATTPTADEVNSFLKALWGYDENRIWSVAAILKTPAPGVAKIIVFVADKTAPGKGTTTDFFTTPDGKHAIAGAVIDFGAKPFAETRKVLQEQANGPSLGAKSNELELVEFGDLQCAHCKEAQATMDNLAQDFPQAKIVWENYPLTEAHPYAFRAAAEGICVRKEKGDAAFFAYAKNVFDKQAALTADAVEATLAAAATAAGADAAATAACAATPAVKEQIEAETKLGRDIGVDQTPMLAVNGHLLPIGSMAYEVLKRIVVYQAGQDGIVVHVQPTLSTLPQ